MTLLLSGTVVELIAAISALRGRVPLANVYEALKSKHYATDKLKVGSLKAHTPLQGLCVMHS